MYMQISSGKNHCIRNHGYRGVISTLFLVSASPFGYLIHIHLDEVLINVALTKKIYTNFFHSVLNIAISWGSVIEASPCGNEEMDMRKCFHLPRAKGSLGSLRTQQR